MGKLVADHSIIIQVADFQFHQNASIASDTHIRVPVK